MSMSQWCRNGLSQRCRDPVRPPSDGERDRVGGKAKADRGDRVGTLGYSATAKPQLKASPAPVVSTTGPALKPGTWTVRAASQ